MRTDLSKTLANVSLALVSMALAASILFAPQLIVGCGLVFLTTAVIAGTVA